MTLLLVTLLGLGLTTGLMYWATLAVLEYLVLRDSLVPMTPLKVVLLMQL